MATEQNSQPAESPTSNDLVRRSLSLSKGLCLIALVFPLVAAIGWIFDLTLLTKGYPTLPAMQPNTAAGLGLAAVAVLLSRDDGTPARGRMPIAALLASVVLLLGVLTLSEYAFGWNLESTESSPTKARPSTSHFLGVPRHKRR